MAVVKQCSPILLEIQWPRLNQQSHHFVDTSAVLADLESRLSRRQRPRDVVFYAPLTHGDRRAWSASVAVGLIVPEEEDAYGTEGSPQTAHAHRAYDGT